jgi:ATP phosphoribosyltransferase regulatory subunit
VTPSPPRSASAGLLPEGLRDVLPPQAEAETALLRRLLDVVADHGYERVQPPLVEFEDSLLDGRVGGAPRDLFRMMDPVSQRMLAVRADMTTQVARIATDRLGHYARPLRLSYAGPVLRVAGTQLRADRQFLQAGAELVGRDDVAAVAEVIEVALAAVRALWPGEVSLDITLPQLVGAIARHHGVADVTAIRDALDAKDSGRLKAAAGAHLGVFVPVLEAAGPADAALAQLQRVYREGEAARMIGSVAALVEAVRAALPEQAITLDPAEHHGFQYQTWVGFSLFAKGVRGEIGRGGAYVIGGAEKAVGFSVYLNGLVEAGVGVNVRQRIFLGADVARADAERLRAEGWVTVRGLEAGDDAAQARAQRCSHMFRAGEGTIKL